MKLTFADVVAQHYSLTELLQQHSAALRDTAVSIPVRAYHVEQLEKAIRIKFRSFYVNGSN